MSNDTNDTSYNVMADGNRHVTEIIEKMDRSSKKAIAMLYDDNSGEFHDLRLTARRRQYMQRLGLVLRVDFTASHIDEQACDLTDLGKSVSKILHEKVMAYRASRAAIKNAISNYKSDLRKAGLWERKVLEHRVLEKRLTDANDARLMEIYSALGGSDIVLLENPMLPSHEGAPSCLDGDCAGSRNHP